MPHWLHALGFHVDVRQIRVLIRNLCALKKAKSRYSKKSLSRLAEKRSETRSVNNHRNKAWVRLEEAENRPKKAERHFLHAINAQIDGQNSRVAHRIPTVRNMLLHYSTHSAERLQQVATRNHDSKPT
jgi:hypothetical protein